MFKKPKNAVSGNALGLKMPERNRESVLGRVAELKRLRDRDASQAMKEHEAKRLEVLAKTARLRAERLARIFEKPTLPLKSRSTKKI
ncbi:MAG: hypothetical protein KKB37_11905 [Alphaproteobacteria bacterium]|nr:hypothetical protein [Alphaproteobacteria bacterium]